MHPDLLFPPPHSASLLARDYGGPGLSRAGMARQSRSPEIQNNCRSGGHSAGPFRFQLNNAFPARTRSSGGEEIISCPIEGDYHPFERSMHRAHAAHARHSSTSALPRAEPAFFGMQPIENVGRSGTRNSEASRLKRFLPAHKTKLRRNGGVESLNKMVGVAGFEPTTTSPPDWCATRLRYTPNPGNNPAARRPLIIAACVSGCLEE